MFNYIIGIIFILHGLVHFIYIAGTLGWLENSDMVLNEKSWVLSKFMSETWANIMGFIIYSIAILLFVASGIGFINEQDWWRDIIIISLIFSSIILLLYWDGIAKNMMDKGFLGIFINIAILVFAIFYDN